MIARRSSYIEPCLPSPAKKPPCGAGWLHEIKHDGFRIMARRDSAGVRLITRNGNDFTSRFPLAVAAVSTLPGRSFLLDGEAIVTDESGLAVFELIRRARHGAKRRDRIPARLQARLRRHRVEAAWLNLPLWSGHALA